MISLGIRLVATFSGGSLLSLPDKLYVPNGSDALVTSDGLFFVTA